ncbi:YheC/YheD family protein [Paenibacillus ginsengarvi]|uniref:YheC/YheD family protein n=2 Tax=Paenibacillus ginsengarvi TaxID=400777 RepID=A0A3B0CJ99_9BACL|nr:YheC/YheD family protein [Paenibacillus ginsengarvi]
MPCPASFRNQHRKATLVYGNKWGDYTPGGAAPVNNSPYALVHTGALRYAYGIREVEKTVMDKRYIGILVNDSWYRRIPSGRTYHESLPCYEKAGKLHGVTPCFFRLKDIKPGQPFVHAYVKSEIGYKRCLIPVPSVIHNRTLYTNKQPKAAIRRLAEDGKRIFNEWNRYGKGYIHERLMEEPSLRPHLPVTRPATPAAIRDMMGDYSKLILKPNSSSIGLGIMKLEEAANGVWLLHGAAKNGRKIAFRPPDIPAIVRRKLRSRPYLVQQLLPLATYCGRPFDLRVSVQRNETGDWQVTGIAAKVAKPGAFRTNVAQGGVVYSLDKVLGPYPELNPEQVRAAIGDFSLRVACQLSRHLPRLADIGLDVGLTEHGFPMFIECNGRDLRYSFQQGNMLDAFQQIYSNPVGFAKYLLESGDR